MHEDKISGTFLSTNTPSEDSFKKSLLKQATRMGLTFSNNPDPSRSSTEPPSQGKAGIPATHTAQRINSRPQEEEEEKTEEMENKLTMPKPQDAYEQSLLEQIERIGQENQDNPPKNTDSMYMKGSSLG